jgi:DNA-binding IclR family transcriptional regulator
MSNAGTERITVESTTGLQSVDRAISVLEILARRGSAGVSEVAAEIGVHKSTAFRLLSALENRDLVEQTEDRGKYELSFGIMRLASSLPGRLNLVRQARPVCERLAATVGETVNLAVIRSHFAINLDQVRGPATVSVQNWVGQLTPLHATSSGKVLLAYLPGATSKALLDEAGLTVYTDKTIRSRRVLDTQLAAARSDGYAVCIEELEDGLNAIAAPIRDHNGAVVAAVSVSGPTYRLDRAQITDLSATVIDAGTEISARMGHLG